MKIGSLYVVKYKIKWGFEVEEFSRLKYALQAQDEYMYNYDLENAPGIIAVLSDGSEVYLK